jgi:hypothetical protein
LVCSHGNQFSSRPRSTPSEVQFYPCLVGFNANESMRVFNTQTNLFVIFEWQLFKVNGCLVAPVNFGLFSAVRERDALMFAARKTSWR